MSATLTYHPNATDPPVALVPDPTRLAVRFGVTRSELSAQAQALLRTHAAPVAQLAGYGITVYDVHTEAARKDAVSLLNRERDVDLAAPVLHKRDVSGDDVYLTGRFVAQFLPEVTRAQIDELNAKYGVRIVEELGYAENGFLLDAPAGTNGLGALETANAYVASGLTVFSHPDLISKRHRRSVTAMPDATDRAVRDDTSYVGRQWHLDDAKVRAAWALCRGKSEIVVAILDDGIDVDHAEFSGKVVGQYDFTAGVADATPKSDSDNHGTACAGVATASGKRSSGAAPDCSLLAVRFPSSLGDADEAKMFQWAADNGADVISCSWGPADGTGNTDPLPGSTQAAISYCVTSGRSGKGIPVCFAAGNGNESVDLDGYASNPDVIAVAAINDHGQRSWYSDQGNAVWVCAPSSGDADAGEKAIITTDRTGGAGYNAGSEDVDVDYTSSFGGTSSASPLVAGIIGLILSANPDLTVSEVRTVLKDTAEKVGTGYDASGHSPEYGYGRVNACEAVRSAQTMTSGGSSSSSGSTSSPVGPSIVGPATLERTAAAPQFTLDPGTGPAIYYAVEVATSAELFDSAAHEADRTDQTFWASWQTMSFLSSNPFQLPDDVWQRLCSADSLAYRAWFSSNDSSWADTTVTTADADAASAPVIQLVDASERSAPDQLRHPQITGPTSCDRIGDPPTLTVRLPRTARSFRVELATAPELFASSNADERTQATYYVGLPSLATGAEVVVPIEAWESLRYAERLFYRVASSPTAPGIDWFAQDTSTPDAFPERCPWIELAGSVNGRSRDAAASRTRVADDDELLWRRRNGV